MTAKVTTPTVDVAKLRSLLHGFSQAQRADVAAAFHRDRQYRPGPESLAGQGPEPLVEGQGQEES